MRSKGRDNEKQENGGENSPRLPPCAKRHRREGGTWSPRKETSNGAASAAATSGAERESSPSSSSMVTIPTLLVDPETGCVPLDALRDSYERCQAVHLPGAAALTAVVARRRQRGSKEGCSSSSGQQQAEEEEEEKVAGPDTMGWKDLSLLFASLNDADRDSWCVENAHADGGYGKNGGGGYDVLGEKPGDFLRGDVNDSKEGAKQGRRRKRGYCSFLVQHSRKVLDEALQRLPCSDLPIEVERGEGTNRDKDDERRGLPPVRYGPCLWFFYGRNDDSDVRGGDNALEGRPEHTDAVSHDGTWHCQLSGVKVWHLRPTDELLKRWSIDGHNRDGGDGSGDTAATAATLICREGDLLLVNTRLWWHRTMLPPQECGVPSVSYARDVYLPWSSATSASKDAPPSSSGALSRNGTEENGPRLCGGEEAMTNVDGLYAANDIEAGTVLFTERDMPDCELHRSSTDPNCEVVELESDGIGDGSGGGLAIVSRRTIKAGEFFCVAESSDDEDEEDDDSEDQLDGCDEVDGDMVAEEDDE